MPSREENSLSEKLLTFVKKHDLVNRDEIRCLQYREIFCVAYYNRDIISPKKQRNYLGKSHNMLLCAGK